MQRIIITGVFVFIALVVVLPMQLLGQNQAYNPYTGQTEDVYRSPLRAILNQFSASFTTGYGRTKYSHNLNGFYFYQDSLQQLLVNNNAGTLPAQLSGYNNWFNEAVLSDTAISIPGSFVADTDTASIGFISRGRSIPLQLSLHYNLMGKFRIGGGIMWERQTFKPFEPTKYGDVIRDFDPGFKKTSYFRYFLLLGYKFYDFWDYSFAAEINLGKASYGKQFSTIPSSLYTSFGLSIEKNLSEYFRIIIKPTYDFKSYKLNLDEQGTSIKHNNATFFVQFGISLTFPEIPRSPIVGDKVNVKHVIMHPQTGKRVEVRGLPIWKHSDPKVGQNDRKLWRYRSGNRKKKNPY
ncbi:MAG: hypothetical protein O2887_12055 [Bacteroidetes bacterium]|nr:hypothetical protein [Bacteroidota bacterium]MDA1121205.1 hypothetical protein [Bacteroidota bacterium]